MSFLKLNLVAKAFIIFEVVRLILALLKLLYQKKQSKTKKTDELYNSTMFIRFCATFIFLAMDFGAFTLAKWLLMQFGLNAMSDLAYAVIIMIISLVMSGI